MPDIQSSDPGRKLQQRYDLLGAPPSPLLSPELVPVVVVDDLTGTDVLSAEFERPCIAFDTFTGVVTSAVLFLLNPFGSGVLTVVESVLFATSTACTVSFRVRRGFGGTIVTFGAFRDGRLAGRPNTGFFPLSLAFTTEAYNVELLVTVPPRDRVDVEFVLEPGDALQMMQSVPVNTLAANAVFTERVL